MVLYFELVHSISISSHVTTSYAEKIKSSSMLNISSYSTSESSNNSRSSSKRSTESAIVIFFPCFTVCIFARNLERDGLGRVGSANREIPFHSSHGIPEISNQNFRSKGKRLRSRNFLFRKVCSKNKFHAKDIERALILDVDFWYYEPLVSRHSWKPIIYAI